MKDIHEFSPRWIETIDHNPINKYSDTDSAYIQFILGFSKFLDVHRTVDYSQLMAIEINKNYLDILNGKEGEHIGVDPEFNLMNFKSEVVAYRGFFNAKKYYALAKIWDEGNFFEKPKMKKTGGQILKADSTEIIFNLLTEIYQNIVLNFDVTDIEELYKIVFIELKRKYLDEIDYAIKNFDIKKIAIPKKWGLRDFKSIPGHVKGAMFYNTYIENTLRPGDSLWAFQVKCKNLKLLKQEFSRIKKEGGLNEYALTSSLIDSKLNMFTVPSGTSLDKLQEIQKILLGLQVELDYDTIVTFNIIKKLDQFTKLFPEEIIRKLQ